VANREGLALDLVTLEQAWRGAALQHRGELPAEIHRIFHGGVVTEPAGGREKVRRIAAYEDAALAVALGDQGVACGPDSAREHLDIERHAEGLAHHVRCRALVDLCFLLVGFELRMKRKLAFAVHSGHETAALAIEAHVHPRRPMRHRAIELRNTAVDGVHAPADEVARDAGLAAI